MAARHVAVSSGRCLGCQRQVLYSFILSLNSPIRSTARQRQWPWNRTNRTFSSTPLQSLRKRYGRTNVPPDNGAAPVLDTSPTEQESETKDGVPWYLEQQQFEPETNPFAERQKIPELPPNPPPILESLLKHISIDLGLDYLSFLDLRGLDPPPALGANLIMVFGSARSERHLNVSADRLCRWLRSEYKLTPYADGLLGRNELKLKMRRRARRAKMMSAAGGVEPSFPDDGVNSGWICVNVGSVENGPDAPREERAFVGFGSQSNTAQIVVQIMTEEKRGETDLEGLWKEILRRAENKRIGLTSGNAESEAAEALHDQSIAEEGPSRFSSQKKYGDRSSPRHTASPGFNQMRSMHTSHRRPEMMAAARSTSGEDVLDELELEPRLLPREKFQNSDLQGDGDRVAGKQTHAEEVSTPPKNLDDTVRAVAMKTQLQYLKGLDPAVALSELGEGQNDRASTAFLSSFYSSVPIFPESEHFQQLVALRCYAAELEHPGYDKYRLIDLLHEMQDNSVWIPEETFLQIIKTLLLTPHFMGNDIDEPGEHRLAHNTSNAGVPALRRSLANAFKVLDAMESYGYSIATEEILLLIHGAGQHARYIRPDNSELSPQGQSNPKPTLSLDARYKSKHTYHLRRAAQEIFANAPLSTDGAVSAPQPSLGGPTSFYLALMRSYIPPYNPDKTSHDWQAFWSVWRLMARLMRPRPPEAYVMALRGVAATGDQARATDFLSYLFEEMGREAVPVEVVGEVRDAVEECLAVSGVDREAGEGVWRRIWAAVGAGRPGDTGE